MTRIRYTMPARSQGKLYMQRRVAEKDVHRWVFACNMAPDVETLVRKWLTTRLDGHPHLSVCGRPFCLDDVDGVDDMEGGAM